MALKLRGIHLGSGFPKLPTFSVIGSAMSSIPYSAGLEGSYFLGALNQVPTYNFTNSGVDLISHGSPTFSMQSAAMSNGTGYFDTQLLSSDTLTFIILSKTQSTSNQSAPISNYFKNGSAVGGDTIQQRNQPSNYCYAQNTDSTVSTASVNADVGLGVFGVSGMIVSAAPAVGAFWLKTDGTVSQSGAVAMTTRAKNGRSLLLGSSYSATEMLGVSDVAAVLIFNTDIGVGNLTTLMRWMRNTVGVAAGIWTTTV
ncbi:hypothetical protein [Serratia marcescens]|uniref:hypothetical protein n=1 Tax=Serratia marcescens TaxID=615 RepID=UPI001F149D05|nr:hypothetical protein [Serratia marcescens]